MRSLATALGCLVIASYATVGSATMGHENEIVASCHFGDNGYVIFRQTANNREGEAREIRGSKPALRRKNRVVQ
jgi:hypothetical protein